MIEILRVDASYHEGVPMCGVAVHSRYIGKIVAAEVMPAPDSFTAEALAAVRACAFLAGRDASAGSEVRTDCLPVVRAVRRTAARHRVRGDVISELATMLRRGGWKLHHCARVEVEPAHAVAGAVLKAWRAGTADEPTWQRNLYFKRPRRGPMADALEPLATGWGEAA